MRLHPYFPVDSIEFALRIAGVALAGVSFAFAIHMVRDSNRKPDIAGIEHLAIYAKPIRGAPPRAQSAQTANIDYTPVGATRGAFLAENLVGFELLEAAPGLATIRTPQGRLARVAPGVKLAGVGAILSIDRRQGKWVVATQAGLIRQR